MTTTTTAAREAAKNLAIYNAIAEHARRAFETLEILPGQYTPAQVVDLLKKSRARWNDDADRLEVARVEVEGFACSFLLADVFAVLAQVATAYEIPTAARVTFERAAETAPAAVSFTITKTAAAEVAKAVAKKDPARAALEFAYIDTDRRALVGTNGHVLTVAPLSSLSVAEGARPGYLVARCLLKADRVTIDTNNNATDGARVAESPAWLRFPAWSSVFPAVCDTDALAIDTKTRRELAKAVAAATKFAGEELTGCRLVSIFGEGYTSKLVVRARRVVAAPTADDPTATRYDVRDTFVQLPAELSRSFALTFHGPDFASLPAFDKMYITPDAGRAAVFAGPHAVAVLIPQPLPDTAERVCSTDSRPAWAKAVDPLADLLAAAPAADSIETPAAETITPAEVAAPAADSIESQTAEPTPATADSIESEAETIETPAAPAADNEAPAFGEWCPLTGETLTPGEMMTADEIRAEVAAERERLAAADSQTTDDTPAEVAAPAADLTGDTPAAETIAAPAADSEADTPAAVVAAADLLARADVRDAAKAIAKAKTADDTRATRDAFEARRLLTREGLTLTDYRIKTADGLTLCHFIYSYGKKSRRTLCAPLLKVAAEFATADSLADEWAELTAAAAADSIESQTAEPTPATADSEGDTLTAAEVRALVAAERDRLADAINNDNDPDRAAFAVGDAFELLTDTGATVPARVRSLYFNNYDPTAAPCWVYCYDCEPWTDRHGVTIDGGSCDALRMKAPAPAADSIESEAETITPAEVAAPAADSIESETPAAPAADSEADTPTDTREADSEAETIEADPLPLLTIDTAAGVIVWGLADELPTADGLTADAVTPADLLTIEAEHAESERADRADLLTIATADSQTADADRAERRPLLLTIARHALRLAAAAALLLLLTIAPDRPADTLAAPADLTATPAPADVLTITTDTLTAAAPAADSIEAESRAELAAPADSPRPAAERRHARENKRESHARALLTVATADSIAAPAADSIAAPLLTIEADTLTADTLTAAPLLLTADSIEADTLTAEVATLEQAREITAPADTLAAGSTLETPREITDAPTADTDSEADTITTDEPTDDTDPAAADSESDTDTQTDTTSNGHPHAHGSTPATMAAPCSPSAPLAPVAPVLI